MSAVEVASAPLAPDAPATCPVCSLVYTPEHRASDDTYRFPDHPSGLYRTGTPDDPGCLDTNGLYLTRDGRRSTPPPGYRCVESRHVVAVADQRRAAMAGGEGEVA